MAKYRITGLPNNKFSNGGEKPKKDKWGRSKGSKWYGFDPDTKEWTLGLPDWKKEEQAKKFKVLNSFSGPFMTPTVGGSSIFSPNQLNIAQPIIPENVKQKQQEALSAELLKNGMIDATRLIRQGGLDKNKEEFIKQQVLEQSGLPTSSQYNFAKNQIVQNKLEELDAAKVNKKPIDLKKFTDDSSKVDYVKTQEQQGWEAMNSLLNDMDNDADVYYNEVKKISDKERGDKSNRDLLREDLLKAINEGKDVDQLLNKIKDKSGEWQYKQLEKKEADTPWIDADSFTPLGLFSKGTKLGQLQRDFVADPLNVAEELIWDQDYMVNRNEILRDPSHPLHAYYMKRTGMDKSPLSQTLQYINPFSSAAESSVAIGKGDYGDAAYQFGEGLVKTAGIAGAVELAPFLGQYTIPGTSGFLPGLTYSQGLNILGAGYGATQAPKTFKSIKKAFEKGDKESIRAAVNQTGTNALDFLGIGELKNVWNVPEKSIFYLAEDLTSSKNFAKDIKDLKATGAIDDFTVQDRLDLWKDAMLETQLKYQKEGYLMKPADVLKNPDMAQYLKSTFEEMKAERVAYLQSPEGRVAVQQMIDEFPEITTGNPDMYRGLNKFGKFVDNTDNAVAKRLAEEIKKDPDAFFNDFTKSTNQKITDAQAYIKWYEQQIKKQPHLLNDPTFNFPTVADKEAEIASLVEQQRLVWGTDKKDLAYLIIDQEGNATPFFNDIGVQSTETKGILSGYSLNPKSEKFTIVKPNRNPYTVDDYIKQLENQSYVEAQNILADNQNFETLRLEAMQIKDDLSKMAPNTPGRGNLERKLNRIEDDLLNQLKGPTGNVKYNAFHSPIDNQTIIGRAFLPEIGENKPLVIAHEMAHGQPQSWTGFNRKAPLKDIFRNYGSQGSWRQGVHPVDKVLSEIDLFDAPPDFTKYRSMRPWYKGDGTNPWPTTVEQIEKGQGMPSLEFSQTTGIADANEALELSGQEWNKAKNYFIKGSFGNEKVTFMAELKQAMLNSGYGERGKFTMKDLESFWKDYIQSSTKGITTGWDLRLLDIARPTTRTKRYMLKGLNMPGYESGGQVNHELGKATASNLEDPTNLKDQYSFYRSLGKLSGIKKKGGSSKPCPEGKIYDPITKQCVSEQAYQIWDHIGTNKQNLDTKQAVIENQNYLDANKFLTDYYNSPRYKQMVYGSAKTPEAAAWIIKSRNKQLETTPPLQVLQQPKDSPYTGGQSYTHTGQIEVFPEGFGTVGTSVHELSHSSDRPINPWNGSYRLIPQKDVDYINEHKAKLLGDSRMYFDDLDYYKSLSKEELSEENNSFKDFYTSYVGDPTETRARLNAIRYVAKKNNLYDPFTQKVTPEIFKNKLKNFEYEKGDKSGFDPMYQLKNTFSDEEIIYMLNNISQNKNPETNDELQYSKKGGPIQLELSDEEIQDYIKRGYVVKEVIPIMSSGGKVVSELWTEITGTPWQEAKTRGLTTGTYDENIALRNRLIAGEFGKLTPSSTVKTDYDQTVENLVAQGKTLDDLVQMRVGTRSGLASRFPQLFGTGSQIPTVTTNEEEPIVPQTIVDIPEEVTDQWGRSTTNKWYGFDPKTKEWTMGIPEWKKDKWGRSVGNKWYGFNPDKKKFEEGPNKGQTGKQFLGLDKEKPKVKKQEDGFMQQLTKQIKEGQKIIKLNQEKLKIANEGPNAITSSNELKMQEVYKNKGISPIKVKPEQFVSDKSSVQKYAEDFVKFFESVPKTAEEFLETDPGKYIGRKVWETGVLPKEKQQQLQRKLDKEGVITIKDNLIKPKAKVKTVKPEEKVDEFYQEVGTATDSYDENNTLLSYRNQWDNNKGFRYLATPVKKDVDPDAEFSNVKGVGHFLLDASASKSKPYKHEYNDAYIKRAIENDDWIPVFKNEDGDYVRVKYKKGSELTKNDSVITPLRQMKFDAIDFSKTQTPKGFKKGINEVMTKDGKGTYLIFKNRDGYSRFSGGSVVFIFKDKFGNTIVRDFAGSLNQIENEGIQIQKQYGINPKDLTIGYHDVGSFSAKVKADDSGKLKANQWSGFNNEEFTGGALLIPS